MIVLVQVDRDSLIPSLANTHLDNVDEGVDK
jgi:hypothetical protein